VESALLESLAVSGEYQGAAALTKLAERVYHQSHASAEGGGVAGRHGRGGR